MFFVLYEYANTPLPENNSNKPKAYTRLKLTSAAS